MIFSALSKETDRNHATSLQLRPPLLISPNLFQHQHQYQVSLSARVKSLNSQLQQSCGVGLKKKLCFFAACCAFFYDCAIRNALEFFPVSQSRLQLEVSIFQLLGKPSFCRWTINQLQPSGCILSDRQGLLFVCTKYRMYCCF